jgi:hypothetical protein
MIPSLCSIRWRVARPIPADRASLAWLQPNSARAARDQLMTEVESLRSADEAANWAHRALGKKNTLLEDDAIRVEQAFQARLAVLSGKFLNENPRPDEPKQPQRRKQRRSVVDKSVLALPAPRRIRDREHVKSVAKQPCLIRGRIPADAHHLKFAQSRHLVARLATSSRSRCAVDIIARSITAVTKPAWWNKSGIDPTISARALWLKTHPLPASPASIEASHSAPVIDNGP